MDETRFPESVPGVIGGKSFKEIFDTLPNIIEFVDSLWQADKTTGVFKLFYVFVKNQLEIVDKRAEHEKRCCDFVKDKKKCAPYMQKYVSSKINTV